MLFTINESSDQITATIPDEDAGQSYDCSIDVCTDPLCRCGEIFVSLKPKPAAADGCGDQPGAWTLGINLRENKLVERDRSSAELSFARKVHALLHEEDYLLLRREYFTRKLESTEAADLTALQAEFPLEEIEQNNTMIGYGNVLPYSRHITLTVNDRPYIVTDLYCVKNDCQCNDSVLHYFPLDGSGPPGNPVLSVFVNHETKQWREVEDPSAGDEPALDDKTAKSELEAEYPNLYALLAQRHRQLKLLYANYLKSRAPRQMPSAKKAGRNEPCPCGSGKKYKKCCGMGRLF